MAGDVWPGQHGPRREAPASGPDGAPVGELQLIEQGEGTLLRWIGGELDGAEAFLEDVCPALVRMAIACMRNGRYDSVSVKLLEESIVESALKRTTADPHLQDWATLEALANGGGHG